MSLSVGALALRTFQQIFNKNELRLPDPMFEQLEQRVLHGALRLGRPAVGDEGLHVHCRQRGMRMGIPGPVECKCGCSFDECILLAVLERPADYLAVSMKPQLHNLRLARHRHLRRTGWVG